MSTQKAWLSSSEELVVAARAHEHGNSVVAHPDREPVTGVADVAFHNARQVAGQHMSSMPTPQRFPCGARIREHQAYDLLEVREIRVASNATGNCWRGSA